MGNASSRGKTWSYSARMENRLHHVLMPIDWWRLPRALCWEGFWGLIHRPMSILSTTEGTVPAYTLCQPQPKGATKTGFESHTGSTFSSNVTLREINFSASHVVQRECYLGLPHMDLWGLNHRLQGSSFSPPPSSWGQGKGHFAQGLRMFLTVNHLS